MSNIVAEIHSALLSFWKQFGVPVYSQGHEPQNAAFPYITFEVSIGDTFSTDVLTAFNWHRAASGLNVYAQRVELMDKIAKAIPREGVILNLSEGFLWLKRNSVDFQSYYDDPTDKNVIGCRTSYQVTFCV